MPWFAVDDGLTDHVKILKAGNAAMGLWVRAGAWCARHLTDGQVPREVATYLGTPAQIKRLIAAGLWAETDSGYAFHQWDERNPSRQKVLERRKSEAEKKARFRAAKSTKKQVNDGCPPGTTEDVPEGVHGGVGSTPPLPSPKEKKKTTSSSLARSRATQAPDHLLVTSAMRQWAQGHDIRVDLDVETEIFLDHHRAKGSAFRDWHAAWRTWMRNSKKYGTRGSLSASFGGSNGHQPFRNPINPDEAYGGVL